MLFSLFGAYPLVVPMLIRAWSSTVRTTVSDRLASKKMTQIFLILNATLHARNPHHCALGKATALSMEGWHVSGSDMKMLANLGFSVADKTLIPYIKKNGEAFTKAFSVRRVFGLHFSHLFRRNTAHCFERALNFAASVLSLLS